MKAAIAFLKLLGAPVGGLLKWLFADWRHVLIVALAIGLANQAFRVAPGLRADIAALTGQRNAKQDTIDNLREEARQAAIRQQGNLVRVDAAHDAINRENVNALQSDIAGLRRRAELLSGQLRASQAQTDSGSANAAGLPGTVSARAGTAEASGNQGLSGTPGGSWTGESWPVTPGAMTIERALIASEQAHQLDRLIDAAEATAAMDLSPDHAAPRDIGTDAGR